MHEQLHIFVVDSKKIFRRLKEDFHVRSHEIWVLGIKNVKRRSQTGMVTKQKLTFFTELIDFYGCGGLQKSHYWFILFFACCLIS